MSAWRAASAVAAILMLTACGGHLRPASAGPTIGGPLRAPAPEGGFSAARPPHHVTFTVTFGAFTLCLTKPGVPVTIDAVHPLHAGNAPFTAYLHEVVPSAVAAAPAASRQDFEAVGSTWGSPPGFAEQYAYAIVKGRHTTDIAGTHVSITCGDARRAGAALDRGQVPDDLAMDLEIVISADGRGAELDGLLVDYTADGKQYRQIAPWRMVVCDTAGTLPGCHVPGDAADG